RATHIEASLPYTAPELLRGRPPSALSDQYALACTAVELLIGRPPFSAETWMELVDAHLNQPVPSFSDKIAWVPRLFDSWLHRALAKIPESRYDSCTELIAKLGRALGS
ncbi:MAG: protein kinase domain-containing protein, partial [Mycobacterium sp.]